MNQQNKLITLTEYGDLSLRELEDKIHKRGINLIKRMNAFHKTDLFQLYYDRIKATQYVGFVKIRDYTIQVIPKIFDDSPEANLHFLLQLLQYTHKIKIKEHDLGNLGKLNDDFFEIIIYLFAKNLRELLRRDFKKYYVSKEENIQFLKGKLLLKEQIRGNCAGDIKYFCKYEEFTENNLMNQILKYTTHILLRISSSNSNKKLLEDILIYLCDVDYICIASSDFDQIHFTRLNRDYQPLVNLCRMVLENATIQFNISKLETFVFMFDMNRLFEEFVFEFIRQNKEKILINGSHSIVFVKDQVLIGKLFNEFQMKGDILIQDDSGRKILLDTKYKILAVEFLHYGLSQSDFYQMFAYSISQLQKYKDIVLLYPRSEGENIITKVLTHTIPGEKPIMVHVKTISLKAIYDKDKRKINERNMIIEMNRAFSLSESDT